MKVEMNDIVAIAKRRGFIYPGSEIYGGLANTYDYGPVGTELLRNIKNLWWEYFVQRRDDVVGLDASLISHQAVWNASGHTSGFADALIDCKNCQLRMRADHLIEDYITLLNDQNLETGIQNLTSIHHDKRFSIIKTRKVEGLSSEEITLILQKFKIPCPKCSEHAWTEVRKFNLLFPVNMGIVEGDQSLAYLRGETAQGMFINFKNVMDSTRVKLPFGIAQLGKSFRNEITPGNSVFRTLEFEQGEIEYFFDPEKSNWEELFENWKVTMWSFATEVLGVKAENLRWREHTDDERSFYSKRTEDMEYQFPFGFKELWGLAYRTDYDLSQHEQHSKKDLKVVDSQSGTKVLPHVIEPAVGINRLLLMVMCDAYEKTEKRTVLKLHPRLAPFKVAVFPLLSNKEELVGKARKVYDDLKKHFTVAFDDRGNIGKRYLYQDEIGTPFCVTIDFDTLEDDTVTVRDRDSMEQKRIVIKDLSSYLTSQINEKM